MNLKEGYNYIGTKDVGFNHVINYDNGVKIPFNEPNFKYADKKAILLCIEGGSAGKKVGVVSEKVCFGNKLCAFHTFGIQEKFLYYFIQSNYFTDLFKENVSGLIGGVSINKIKELIIPLPSLSEQKRIVSEIERIFSETETIKSNQNKLASLKDGLKNKILDLAIRGKLVEQDPNDEPASVLLEKIKAEKAELVKQGKIKKDKIESYIYKTPDNRHYEKIGSELKDITDEIPFEIPENWCWCRLGSVIKLVSGRDLTANCYSDVETKDSIPYITGASNINNEQVVINRWTVAPQTFAYKGDLLLTCKGTVGLIAFLQNEKVHIARQLMALKTFSYIDMNYLKYFVLSYIAELQRKAKSMIPGISREDVLQTLCPIAPFREQQRIAGKIRLLLDIIENL